MEPNTKHVINFRPKRRQIYVPVQFTGFILLENGSKLLLENGSKILKDS